MPRQKKLVLSPNPAEAEMARKVALLRKVRARRDGTRLNMGAVEGDPSMEYRWVNSRQERQLTYKAAGYSLVCNPDDESVKSNFKQPDGTHVRGDTILYHIPKEEAEAIHADDVLRGIEYLDDSKAQFETYADQNGIPTFVPQH